MLFILTAWTVVSPSTALWKTIVSDQETVTILICSAESPPLSIHLVPQPRGLKPLNFMEVDTRFPVRGMYLPINGRQYREQCADRIAPLLLRIGVLREYLDKLEPKKDVGIPSAP